MDKRQKQLHIRLDKDLYKKLKVKCAIDNLSIQDSIGKVIENLVKYPLIQHKNGEESEKLEILALFQQCPLLSELDRYDLESLAGAAVVHYLKKGSIIDQEGEISISFHIIKNGIVKIFKAAPSGKEFIIDVRCKGEVFGEASVLKAVPHCASTKALQDTEVVDIRRKDFLDLMARNPAIAQKIADMEFDKIQRLYESMLDLVATNAQERLIKLIYRLGRKYGSTLRFTHQEIAEMSGTTAETVTRVLTQLRRAGVLRLTRGRVIIIDARKLQASAG